MQEAKYNMNVLAASYTVSTLCSTHMPKFSHPLRATKENCVIGGHGKIHSFLFYFILFYSKMSVDLEGEDDARAYHVHAFQCMIKNKPPRMDGIFL
jgi:hypothetical protein